MSDEEEIFGCYGVVVPERKFHISTQCPCIRTITGWKRAEVTNYTREADAILMGHTNRCPICFNMYRFNIKIGDKVSEVLIDKYDLDVLLGIAKLHRDGKPITVTDICTHINMGFGETNDTIKRLRKLKLVANAEYTGTKQIRGKRKFTALGYAVVIAYESNIYGMPINSIPAQELKANTRLI